MAIDPDRLLTDVLDTLGDLHERERTALPDELPEKSQDERMAATGALVALYDHIGGGGDAPDVKSAVAMAKDGYPFDFPRDG